MAKSHVSLEQNVCAVCGHTFDTGAVLLDRRMRDSLEHKTLTGWGLCDGCQEKHDEGYVALVVVDEEKSTPESDDTIKPEGAYRTGEIGYIRRGIWDRIFNVPAPDGPMCFVPADVVARLAELEDKEA